MNNRCQTQHQVSIFCPCNCCRHCCFFIVTAVVVDTAVSVDAVVDVVAFDVVAVLIVDVAVIACPIS